MRDGRDDLGLFGGGVLIAPEGVGGDRLAIGRKLFPEL